MTHALSPVTAPLPGDVTTPAGVAKLITYIGLAVAAILVTALADDQLSTVELLNAAIAAVGALLVYEVTNAHGLKTIATFALAGLQALVLVVTDVGNLGDVSIANWLAVVIAAFAGIGVAFVPNKVVTPNDAGVYIVTGVEDVDEGHAAR